MRTSVDVHNSLVERDAPHEMFPIRGRLRTPQRIPPVLGVAAEEVGKVVVFEGPSFPVAAVVPCEEEPDPTRVSRAVGTVGLKRATGRRASALTEYLAEWIPPAGLPETFVVVIDESLDRDAVLYFPGGEVRSLLKIRGVDLVRAARATVANIVSAPARGARRGGGQAEGRASEPR